MKNLALYRRAALIPVVTVTYYFASLLGYYHIPPIGDPLALWIPAGLGTAAVLLRGSLSAVGIFTGSLLFRLVVLSESSTLPATIGVSLLYAIEALVCATLMRKITSRVIPRDIRETVLNLGAVAATALVSAAAGSGILGFSGIATWNEYATTLARWWLGDASGIWVLTPALYLLFRPRHMRRSLGETILWPFASFLLGLSLFVFLQMDITATKQLKDRLVLVVKQHASLLSEELRHGFSSVNSVQAFFTASENVEPEEFKLYINQIIKSDPAILAMTWNPLVIHEDRLAYEAQLRSRGFSGLGIFEADADGNRIPAGERGAYFPSTMLEPMGTSSANAGFDIASSPPRRSAILKALQKAGPVFSEPLSFLWDDESRSGILIVAPIYQRTNHGDTTGERQDRLLGIVTASYTVQDWLHNALRMADQHDVELFLYDVSNDSDPIFLAFHPSLSGRQTVDTTVSASLSALQTGIYTQQLLNEGGRSWLLIGHPGPGFFRQAQQWVAWLILLGGLILTVIFLGFMRERMKLEAVQGRSEAEFRGLADNAVSGIMRLMETGELLYSNSTAAAAFGYQAPEAFMRDGLLGRLVNPEVFPGIVKQLKTRGSVSNYDLEIRTTDNQLRHLLLSAALVDTTIITTFTDITERQKLEEALKRRDQDYQLIAENTGDTIWILDLETQRFSFMSPSVEKMRGYTAAEVMDQGIDQVLTPESLAYVQKVIPERLEAFLRDGTRVTHIDQLDQTTKGGEIIHTELMSSYAFNDQGKIQVVGITRDITERKRAEEQMASIKASLELAQGTARLGSWELDPDSGKGTWSKEMFELFRRDPGLGTPELPEFMQLVHPEDHAALLAAQQKALETGEQQTVEYRSAPDQGEPRYYKASFLPELGSDGYYRMMSGTVLDISDLKAAQIELETLNRTLEHRVAERTRELEQSEATYRALFDESREGILLMDGQYRVLRINQSLAEILGYTKEDFHAMESALKAFNSSEGGKLVADSLYRSLQGENVPNFEAALETKAGVVVDTELDLSVIHDDQGAVSVIQLMIRDIGERKKAETALLESHKRMQEANEALEMAALMKDEFLANMSHEIRTPMNAIIGLSGLALKTELSDKQRDYVSKIQTSGLSLLGIINDILDFSKIEAGKLSIEKVDFDLDEVLGNVGAMVSQRVMEKNLEFLLNFPSDIPRRWFGDPLRISQVLLNIVTNSVKFTKQGEIEVSVKLVRKVNRKCELLFEIRDTGIGMSKEILPRLFTPFTQADSSTTRKYGGTGLGLSISKRLVELMGGTIRADSEAGKGSTFSFTVWLEEATSTAEQKPKSGFTEHGTKALVVDDNALARTIHKDILEDLQFQVETVDSGEKALERISEDDTTVPFSLVIMDLKMPGGMDGIETTRRIKKELPLVNVPVVFIVTGSYGEEAHPQATTAGAEDYLVKPLTLLAIKTAVLRNFTGQRLPLTIPESLFAASDPATRNVKLPGIEKERNLAGIRVLLVEDNAINQQIALELLQSCGAEVTLAMDGSEAVKAITQAGTIFDVVLMDIQMPVMDGYEAARLVRADSRFEKLPIIAMTAHVMESDRQKVLAAGMNDHIPKPLDPDQMFDTIERYINKTGKNRKRTTTRQSSKQQSSTRQASTRQSTTKQTSTRQAASRQTTPEEDAALMALAEFDAHAGLTRLAGNSVLYRDLLGKFATGHKEGPGQISAAFSAGDYQKAEREAHSLKGVAGNIGATGIQHAAESIETMIRQGDTPEKILEAVATLQTIVDRAVNELAALLDTDAGIVAEPKPSDPQRLSLILAELTRLVQADDPEAVAYFTASRPELLGSFGTESLEAFEKAMISFDFTAALDWLRNNSS
jgi:PAS domain S-box-containing protein